jgi:hypothetical protein
VGGAAQGAASGAGLGGRGAGGATSASGGRAPSLAGWAAPGARPGAGAGGGEALTSTSPLTSQQSSRLQPAQQQQRGGRPRKVMFADPVCSDMASAQHSSLSGTAARAALAAAPAPLLPATAAAAAGGGATPPPGSPLPPAAGAVSGGGSRAPSASPLGALAPGADPYEFLDSLTADGGPSPPPKQLAVSLAPSRGPATTRGGHTSGMHAAGGVGALLTPQHVSQGGRQGLGVEGCENARPLQLANPWSVGRQAARHLRQRGGCGVLSLFNEVRRCMAAGAAGGWGRDVLVGLGEGKGEGRLEAPGRQRCVGVMPCGVLVSTCVCSQPCVAGCDPTRVSGCVLVLGV